jgi:hypothetical protein
VTAIRRQAPFILLFTFALAIVPAAAAASEPLPVTSPERAASEAVAAWLASGPQAIYGRLASDARFRTVKRPAALEEIEVRLGPPAGSRWSLSTTSPALADRGAIFSVSYPSGVDETVHFEMTLEAGEWRIADLRPLGEPDEPPVRSAAAPAPAEPASHEALSNRRIATIATGILAPLLALFAAWIRAQRETRSLVILSLAIVLFAGYLAATFLPVKVLQATVDEPTIEGRMFEMRSLLPLRRQLASAGSAETQEAAFQYELGEIALLWEAQAALATGDAASARPRLDRIELLRKSGLAHLLRARLAIADGDERTAALEYQRALSAGPARDTLWREAFLSDADDVILARDFVFDHLSEFRTRDAGFYYIRAMGEVLAGESETARRSFTEAWQNQPLERETIIRSMLYAGLLRDPAIAELINLRRPDEPQEASFKTAQNPITVPEDARAYASGRFVRITIGDATLDLPSGAPIAPAGTELVSASKWRELETAATLRELPHLIESNAARSPSPIVRERAENAAKALAAEKRWDDVLKLTESLDLTRGRASLPLVTHRVRALARSGRPFDASAITEPANLERLVQKKEDSHALIELAEAMTEAGAYDAAVALYRKVSSIDDAPDVAARIRYLDLRRYLGYGATQVDTTNFTIRCGSDVPEPVAQRIGEILEAEYARLARLIPMSSFERIRVNVLSWNDFRYGITGSNDIVGLYDGQITFPFASVTRFSPEIVSILTHELTHAMLAQATRNNAPRWFQEGMAQRMELIPRQPNVFEGIHSDRVLALSLLDATMEDSIDRAAIGESYLISLALIHYIEQTYGERATSRLVVAFRRGASTAAALREITGKEIADVDRDFRRWGEANRRPFADARPWPYGAASAPMRTDPQLPGIRFSRERP